MRKWKKKKKSSLNFSKKHRKFNMRRFKYVMTWVWQIALAIIVAIVIVNMFGTRTNVVGQAMAENLTSGDEVLINKLTYAITNPKAGDVIVFLPNGNDKSHYYIRRVVGVPGDTIQIVGGILYVNGNSYNELTTVASMEEAGIAESEILLGEDEYFVLGDNRNNSEDSRYANIGNVKKEYIIGKAWFYIDSEDGMGFVH